MKKIQLYKKIHNQKKYAFFKKNLYLANYQITPHLTWYIIM